MKRFKILLLAMFIMPISWQCLSQDSTFNAQVIKINDILRKSLFKTKIAIDSDGYLTRVDNNENQFMLNIFDVECYQYKYDGNHNILIQLKDGKKVIGKLNYGKRVEYPFNLLGFKKREHCDSAMKYFLKVDSLKNTLNKE